MAAVGVGLIIFPEPTFISDIVGGGLLGVAVLGAFLNDRFMQRGLEQNKISGKKTAFLRKKTWEKKNNS